MAANSTSRLERALDAYAQGFQRWLPSPFSIAVLLTLLAALLALRQASATEVVDAWTQGLWNPDLIRFGFQAMFMLVLGHVLALAPPVLSAASSHPLVVKTLPTRYQGGVVEHADGMAELGTWIDCRGHLGSWCDGRRRQRLSLASDVPSVCWALRDTQPLGVAWWVGGSALEVTDSRFSSLASGLVGGDLPDALTLSDTPLTGWSQVVTGAVVAVVWPFVVGKAPGCPRATIFLSGTGTRPVEATVDGFAERLTRVAPCLTCWAWRVWQGLCCGVPVGAMTQLALTPDWINMVLLGAALVALDR